MAKGVPARRKPLPHFQGCIKLRLFMIAVCCAFVSTEIHAAEWSILKSLSLNEVYTDNVRLANSGKESAFITQVVPNLSVRGKGARANIDLSGSVRYNQGGPNSGSLTPRLSGKANTELVQDTLFLDADASITQNAIDPYGDIGVQGINQTSNVTTTYRYSLSPHYKNRIRGVGNIDLRYRYTDTSHSVGTASNSGSQYIVASLKSGPEFSRLNWGVTTDYRSSSSSGGSGSDLISTDVLFGYRFDRKWQVNGTVGREWNSYASTKSSTGGARWTLNTTWTPNPRTSLRIGYGNRYFGSTPTLDLTYKSRHSRIKAGYSRVVTDAKTQLEQLATDPVTGDVYPVAVLTNDIYVDQRFTGSYTLEGRRTTFTLSATHSTQVYQNSPQSSELAKLGMILTRSLSGRVRASAIVNWYQQDKAASSSAQTWQGALKLSVRLGRKTSMNVGYTYNQREDDVPANSYVENRANIGLSIDL